MTTLEYATGRAVDTYGEPGGPTVLLWHGMQADARASVRRLAEALAEHRLDVVVPDWNSHAADGGRADLLASVAFARARDETLVVVGWSMGGAAAADLTLNAGDFELALHHTVCLAGAFTATGPISGVPLRDAADDVDTRTPFTLLHGTADDVVPASVSAEFSARLARDGWPVRTVELDTDHGAIAGARYDEAADRYDPADDPTTLAVVADVAARIADVAGR